MTITKAIKRKTRTMELMIDSQWICNIIKLPSLAIMINNDNSQHNTQLTGATCDDVSFDDATRVATILWSKTNWLLTNIPIWITGAKSVILQSYQSKWTRKLWSRRSRQWERIVHRCCPSVCLLVCLSPKCKKMRFSQKLSNLELWFLLTTYRKSYMGFSKK